MCCQLVLRFQRLLTLRHGHTLWFPYFLVRPFALSQQYASTAQVADVYLQRFACDADLLGVFGSFCKDRYGEGAPSFHLEQIEKEFMVSRDRTVPFLKANGESAIVGPGVIVSSLANWQIALSLSAFIS